MSDQREVFAVGSCEHNFIVDRIYFDRQSAIEYCDSRRNYDFEWAVVHMEDGKGWIDSKFIHSTPRKGK